MAIQPNLNVSLKPIAFPCQNLLEKASIFARPQSLSLSRFKPLNHSHSTRILKLSATAAAEAAAPVTEDTLTDDNSTSESPPDKEVPPLSLSLSLSLLTSVRVVNVFFLVQCLVSEKI